MFVPCFGKFYFAAALLHVQTNCFHWFLMFNLNKSSTLNIFLLILYYYVCGLSALEPHIGNL